MRNDLIYIATQIAQAEELLLDASRRADLMGDPLLSDGIGKFVPELGALVVRVGGLMDNDEYVAIICSGAEA